MFSNGDIIITSVVDKHEYTVKISKFNLEGLPNEIKEIGISVCDITLDVVKDENQEISLNLLKSICYTLFNYIEKYDIIYYYYCSPEVLINRHCVKENIPPQRYRRMLFKRIFDRHIQHGRLIKMGHQIIDTEGIEHHIVIIAKPENQYALDIISSHADNMKK